jgi:hypothetical protein
MQVFKSAEPSTGRLAAGPSRSEPLFDQRLRRGDTQTPKMSARTRVQIHSGGIANEH